MRKPKKKVCYDGIIHFEPLGIGDSGSLCGIRPDCVEDFDDDEGVGCEDCLSIVREALSIDWGGVTIEEAFKEGYDAGYIQGEDDMNRFERGNGTKHDKVKAREKEDNWRSSDAFHRIHEESEP